MAEEKKTFTSSEIASMCDVHVETVRRWMRDPNTKIKSEIKPGRRGTPIDIEEVLNFANSHDVNLHKLRSALLEEGFPCEIIDQHKKSKNPVKNMTRNLKNVVGNIGGDHSTKHKKIVLVDPQSNSSKSPFVYQTSPKIQFEENYQTEVLGDIMKTIAKEKERIFKYQSEITEIQAKIERSQKKIDFYSNMLRGVGIEEIPDAPIPAQPPRIKIAGIGGGAGNIINRLMSEPLPNTEYIVIDTEKEFLHCSKAHVTLQIDETVTEGFSSASDPAVGQTCALAESEQIAEVLKECDLLFLITCLGGRTGTGAAPVIVRIAQDLEIETHVIAVTPFKFEGTIRSQQAEKAIQSLRSVTDHLTVLSNDEYKTGPNASLAETYTAVNHAVIEEIQKMIE